MMPPTKTLTSVMFFAQQLHHARLWRYAPPRMESPITCTSSCNAALTTSPSLAQTGIKLMPASRNAQAITWRRGHDHPDRVSPLKLDRRRHASDQLFSWYVPKIWRIASQISPSVA